MRPSHVNDRKSTGARDDDGNDDDPSNKGGSKRRALSMETAINTAVTASTATKDARVKGEEVLTESTPLEVDRASERSGAKEHLVHAVKNPKRRRRGRRTPPLSERPKTLSGAIREIRATLVDPTIAKLEFYREKDIRRRGPGGRWRHDRAVSVAATDGDPLARTPGARAHSRHINTHQHTSTHRDTLIQVMSRSLIIWSIVDNVGS